MPQQRKAKPEKTKARGSKIIDGEVIDPDIVYTNAQVLAEAQRQQEEEQANQSRATTFRSNRRYGHRRLTAQQRVALETKENEGLRMIVAGATYDMVASALGYAERGAAYRAVHRALNRQSVEDSKNYRKVQNSRLDMLFRALLGQALGKLPCPEYPDGVPPDLNAMDRLLRIEEFRARLLGTLAPKELDIDFGKNPLESYSYDDALALIAPRPEQHLLASGQEEMDSSGS